MIKRIDLKRDYERYKDEYDAAIKEVLEQSAFSGGFFADRFDKEFADYIGVKAASGVNNGTSALHMALKALEIGAGDEVIVPANTFIATAWAVSYTGAVPVFVDCTADTWEIDPELCEAAITPRTKAVLGVHLYGQPFDFNAVKEIAKDHSLFVVEDCAQAHGALYEGKKTGSLGTLGCFSFYPGKNLYCFGEGGSVTGNDEDLIERVNVMKNQGSKERYHHEVLGYNYRLEGIQGAVLSVGLKHLDEQTAKRQRTGERYIKEIDNELITMQAHPENTTPVYHLFEIQTDDPARFIAYMERNGVECHRHYPVPCHLQKAYEHLGYKKGDCPNAEKLANRCVTLPLFPELTDEEADTVIGLCNDYR